MSEVGKAKIDLGQIVTNADKLVSELKKIEGAEKSAQSLLNIVAIVTATGEKLKTLSGLADISTVVKYLESFKKIADKINSLPKISQPDNLILPELKIKKPTATSMREQLIDRRQAEIRERLPAKDSKLSEKISKTIAERGVSDKDVSKALSEELGKYKKQRAEVEKKRDELQKLHLAEIEKTRQQVAQLGRDTKSMLANLTKLFNRINAHTEKLEIADRHARRAALDPETRADVEAYEELRRKEAERDYGEQKVAHDSRLRQELADKKLQAKLGAKEVLRPAFPEIGEVDKINTVGEINKEIAARTNLVKIRDDEYKAVTARVSAEKDPEVAKILTQELANSASRLKTAHELRDAAKERLVEIREEEKQQKALAAEEKQRFEERKREIISTSKWGKPKSEPEVGLLSERETIKDVREEITQRAKFLEQRKKELALAREMVSVAKDERELKKAEEELYGAEQELHYAEVWKKQAEDKLALLREEETQLRKNKTEALAKAKLVPTEATISKDLAKEIAQEKALISLKEDSLETVRDEIAYKQQMRDIADANIQDNERQLSIAEQSIKNAKTEEEVVRALVALEETRSNLSRERTTRMQAVADIDEYKKIEHIMTTLQATDRLVSEIGKKMKTAMSAKELTKDISLVNRELARIPAHLRPEQAEKLQSEMKKMGINTTVVGDKLELVRMAFMKTKTEASGVTAEMFSLEKIIQRASFVVTAKLSYVSFDRLIGMLKSSVMSFVSFEDEMSKTFSLLAKRGASVHREMMELVQRSALDYRMELKSVSEALYQIVSAQFDAKDAALVLDAAMKLAVGGFSEAKDAALALVQILNAFEMDASQAEHVADVMFETSRLGIITTQQYANEISKVASTASMFGLSVEDISAAISVMTRNGVKVDHAFTSLNQMLMTIANPTEKARKVMDAYGVSLDMNKVRAQGLMGALSGLGDILKSEEAMLEIFKTRTGARAMFRLVQHEEEYVSDLIQMYSNTGAAQEAVNVRLRTTEALLKKMRAESSQLGVEVGKRLNDSFKSMIDTATAGLSNLSGMIELTVAGIRSLVSVLVTVLAVQVVRIVAQIIRALKLLVVKIQEAGIKAAVSWAQITAGLSLIVSLITFIVGAIIEFGRTAEKNKISEKLGLRDAEKRLSDINKEIADLDSGIAKMKGIDKLLSQFDELNKTQNKNAKAQELLVKLGEDLAVQLSNILGIEVKTADVETNLGRLRDALFEKRIAQERQVIGLLLQQQAIQTGKSAKGVLEDKPKTLAKEPYAWSDYIKAPKGVGELDELFTIFAKEVTKVSTAKEKGVDLLRIARSAGGEIIEKKIQEVIDAQEKEVKKAELRYEEALPWYTTPGDTPSKGQAKSILLEATKRYEDLLDYTSKMREVILDFEIATTQYELGLDDILYEQYEPEISKALKDLKGAAAGSGRQVRDYIFEIVDKYIDLFRSVGFAVEDSFGDKLVGINEQVEKLKKDVYAIIPDESVTRSLSTLGNMLQSFALFDGEVKKKNRNLDDIIGHYDKAAKIMRSGIRGNEEKYKEMGKNLVKLGKDRSLPRIVALGESLLDMYNNGVTQLQETLDDYFESEFEKLMRKARSEAEREELSLEILKLNEKLYDFVIEGSFTELEKLLKEEDTKNTVKPAIQAEIRKRKAALGKAMIALSEKFGFFVEDLEKGLYDITNLIDSVRQMTEMAGLDVDVGNLSKLMEALLAGEKDEFKRVLNKIQKDRKIIPAEIFGDEDNIYKELVIPSVEEAMELEPGRRMLYIKHFADLYKKSGDDIFKTFLDNINDEIEAIRDKAQDEIDKIKPDTKEVITGSKDARTKNIELINAIVGSHDYQIRLSEDGDKVAGLDSFIRQFKDISKKYSPSSRSLFMGKKDFDGKKFSEMNIDEQLYAFASLLSQDQAKTAKKHGAPQIPQIIERFEEYSDEAQAALDEKTKEIDELNLLLEEISGSEFSGLSEDALYKTLEDLLSGTEHGKEIAKMRKMKDYKGIRDLIRKLLGKGGSAGETLFGDLFDGGGFASSSAVTLKDFAKDKLKWGEGITLDEAYEKTIGKSIEIAHQAIEASFDWEIEKTEEHNRRLIELEQQKTDAILANENISSAEREVIQAKFAERQRKLQEENDKKVAKLRKKQELTMLKITYARGIAEVFIRETSKHGILGIGTAALLAGMMTANYLAQRAMIEKQKFASGGYTGAGFGRPDSTGQRPAGIVHERELVIDRKTLARNFDPLVTMYAQMRKGQSFDNFALSYLLGRHTRGKITSGGKSFAGGGYTGDGGRFEIDLKGLRVIDDVELATLVERGGKKRRYING